VIEQQKIEKGNANPPITILQGKVVSKISVHSQQNMTQIRSEIEANRRLHHQNVLRMQMYLEDEVFHYLIFPDPEKMALSDIIHIHRNLSEEAARPIFRELILGVQHMHSNCVIHGQVTPASVLFWKNHVRLSDFSRCTLAARGQEIESKNGPLMYMAPESLKDGTFDGSLNDIWSCGIILYEMLAGHVPFDSGRSTDQEKQKALVIQVKRGNIVYPNSFSSCVIFLLKGILTQKPTDRLSIEQILSHPWMLKTREVPIAYTLHPGTVQSKKKAARQASPLGR
jgi:serine/threonine protein kinase